jgi:hypothetical protein
MVRVRVTGALPYDLIGALEEEKAAGKNIQPPRKRTIQD